MAGGDLRVSGGGGLTSVGVQGAKIGNIDANSKASGNFTEQRNVGGQDIWLTTGGAKALDAAKANGGDGTIFEMKVSKDPSALSDWFWNTKERPETIGKP